MGGRICRVLSKFCWIGGLEICGLIDWLIDAAACCLSYFVVWAGS